MKDKNNINYNLLFEKPENLGTDIDVKIYKLSENMSQEQLKKTIKDEYNYSEDYFSYCKLDGLIQLLTSLELRYQQSDFIEGIRNIDVVKQCNITGDGNYKIETIDGNMIFSSIVKQFNILDNGNYKIETMGGKIIYSTRDHEGMNELISYEKNYFDMIRSMLTRLNHCHGLAINASEILLNYFKLDNKVVTGYIYSNTEKNRFLHSWNEFELNGRQVVLDSTLNVIMNKEGYYLLKHIKEEEILSKIDGKKVKEDLGFYGSVLGKEIDLKTYLTSRDEIIKDLNKNAHLFNKFNDWEER